LANCIFISVLFVFSLERNLLRFKWLVAVTRLLENSFIEIGVNPATTFEVGRVVDTTPIYFGIALFLFHKHVAFVFQLRISLLT